MVVSNFSTIGSTGLRHSNGKIIDELHRDLQGPRKNILLREMADNDAIVGSIILSFKNLGRRITPRAKPSGDSPEQLRQAKFLDECLVDMSHSFGDFLSEIFQMIIYGYAPFEIIYKYRGGPHQTDSSKKSLYSDNLIGWRKFSHRSPFTIDRWGFDPTDSGLTGLYQNTDEKGQVFIPIDKLILFRTESTLGNPEGRSLLRNAFRAWRIVKRLQEIEVTGMSRDLVGYPVMEVPPHLLADKGELSSTDLAIRNELEEIIQDMHRDEREGMLIPAEFDSDGKHTGFKIRLLQSGGTRSLNIDGAIKRWETRIAMSVHSEFAMIGMDRVGGQASSESKMDFFTLGVEAFISNIFETFNRFAVRPLFLLNGIDAADIPQVVHSEVFPANLNQIGSFLTQMAQIGGFDPQDSATQKWVRTISNAPDIEVANAPRLSVVPNGGIQNA